MKVILLLGLVTVVACQTPELDTKPFACTADSQCGEGYFCGAGRCVPIGTELCDGTNPDAVECDVPAIIIEAGETATHESGLSVTLTVRLSTRPNASVGLDLRVSDSTEARLTPETYLVEPGTWDTPLTLTVTGLDDAEPDGSVAYQVKVSATSQDTRFNGLVGQVDLVNHDDDTPDLLVDVLSSETTEAGGEAKVSVRLATQPIRAVVVRAVSSDPTEGRERGDLQFDTDTWFTPQVVTVVGVDDGERDGDTNYELVLTATGVPEYEGLTKSIPLLSRDGVCGNGVIDGAEVCDGANADACTSFGPTPSEQRCVECACGGPAVVLRASGVLEEGGSRVTLSARLRTAPEASVRLNFAVRETAEAKMVGSSLSFSASDWSTPQTVQVEAIDDDRADGPRLVTIDVSVSTDDTTYRSVTVDPLSLTAIDNDTAGLVLVLAQGSQARTTEVGGKTTLRASLKTEPLGDVRVNFAVPAAAPVIVSDSYFTFTAANWRGIDLTLTGDDNQAVGPASYELIMARVSGSATEYVGVAEVRMQIDSVDGKCGNGLTDGTEACDGVDRDSCQDLGWRIGTTTCSSDCLTFDSSPCGHGFTAVASTAGGGCAVDRSGKLKCWGSGRDLLPRVEEDDIIEQLAGGVASSSASANGSICALTSEGRVRCSSSTMTTSDRFERIVVGLGTTSYLTGCGVKTDGTLACWGTALSVAPPAGSGFIDVSVGDRYACAIKATGAPTCWGTSPPTPTNQGPFVQVVARSGFSGNRHVCGRKSDNSVWCSDRTVTGQFRAISQHGSDTYGLKTDGTVIDLSSANTSWGEDLTALGGACGVTSDGEVRCWHETAAWPSGRPYQAVQTANGRVTILRDGMAFTADSLSNDDLRAVAPRIDDFQRILGGRHLARGAGSVYSVQSNQILNDIPGQVLRLAWQSSSYSSCWILTEGSLRCGAGVTPPPVDRFIDLANASSDSTRGFVGITQDGGGWTWQVVGISIPVPSDFPSAMTAVSVSRSGNAACYRFSNGTVACLDKPGSADPTVYPPPSNSSFSRVIVDNGRSCFIGIRNGQLVSWGPSCSGLTPPAGTGFVDVGLDGGRGYALKNDGTLVPIGSVPALPE